MEERRGIQLLMERKEPDRFVVFEARITADHEVVPPLTWSGSERDFMRLLDDFYPRKEREHARIIDFISIYGSFVTEKRFGRNQLVMAGFSAARR